MTLKSSKEIFQALEPLQPHDLYSLNNLSGLNDLKTLIWSNILLNLIVGSSLAHKLPIHFFFCGMDCQKSNFSLISDTFSVGGCWGRLMLLFYKLVDETQISATPEDTRHHNSRKLLVLLSLRAIYNTTLQCEIPCNTIPPFWIWSLNSCLKKYWRSFSRPSTGCINVKWSKLNGSEG